MISIIIPVYNNETTVASTISWVYKQNYELSEMELIIIDDASSDSSKSIIKRELNNSPKGLKVSCIFNDHNEGTACNYNKGIRLSSGNIVVLLHADIDLEPDSLSILVAPLKNDAEVIGSYGKCLYTKETWKKYGFWEKCLFSRHLGKNKGGIDGKFNAFRKDVLVKVGLFNSKNFYTAGEDGDMVIKLSGYGKIVATEAVMYHIHDRDVNFSLAKLIYKHKQYANAQGALLRIHGIRSVSSFIRSFYKELLIIGLILPYIGLISLVAILIFVFLYTWDVYLSEIKNTKVIILPLVNFYILVISTIYSLKGFIDGEQRI